MVLTTVTYNGWSIKNTTIQRLVYKIMSQRKIPPCDSSKSRLAH